MHHARSVKFYFQYNNIVNIFMKQNIKRIMTFLIIITLSNFPLYFKELLEIQV